MIRLPLTAVLATLLAAAPLFAFAGPPAGDGAGGAPPVPGMDGSPGMDGGPGMGRGPGMRAGRDGPRRGPRHGPLARKMHRQQRKTMRLLRALELSDAQRGLVADGSALAAPVRQDLHAKIRAIFEDARTSPRTKETRVAVRAKVKEAVQAALASLEAPARRLLDSLTPDQRAKLEAKAKEHGKAFDEAKLTKAFEGLFLAPKHGRHGPRDGRDGAGPREGAGRHGRGRGFGHRFRGGDGR